MARTTQNMSSAVMQQRREPKDALDDFPTPPWATRALCEWLSGRGENEYDRPGYWTAREPAANRGYMVRPLREYFAVVYASDVANYGLGYQVMDFLWRQRLPEVDWTITNPPFRVADQFVRRARETSQVGVAMFVRSAFLEDEARYGELFEIDPPHHILQFVQRVVIRRGKIVKGGSSATSYCWLVWKGAPRPGTAPAFHWIPPVRDLLVRPGDYDRHGYLTP